MKDIKGYEGLYAITKDGKVWSYRRNRWLTPCNNGCGGYWYIKALKDGIIKTVKIHRAVAEAYIPNPEGKAQVNHIDENKDNNCVDNLEWVNCKDNVNHGTHNKRVANALKNKKKVRCLETGIVYHDAGEAATAINRSWKTMEACVKGYTKTCGGYHWEYLDEND